MAKKKMTAGERYERSRHARRKRALWRKRNRAKLRANLLRHRAKLAAIRGVGEVLRDRFPQFTGAAGATAKPETGHPAGAATVPSSDSPSVAVPSSSSSRCGRCNGSTERMYYYASLMEWRCDDCRDSTFLALKMIGGDR